MAHFNSPAALWVRDWALSKSKLTIALHGSLFTAALPHLDSSQLTQADSKSPVPQTRDKYFYSVLLLYLVQT